MNLALCHVTRDDDYTLNLPSHEMTAAEDIASVRSQIGPKPVSIGFHNQPSACEAVIHKTQMVR